MELIKTEFRVRREGNIRTVEEYIPRLNYLTHVVDKIWRMFLQDGRASLIIARGLENPHMGHYTTCYREDFAL